jgi:tetratricopeptide (TPR) repeat protein
MRKRRTSSAGDVNEECATTAAGATAALSGKSSSANVAATGLLCALDLPAEVAGRSDLVKQLEKASREALDDPRVVVPADDRSGVFEALVMAREDAGDEKGVKAVAKEWAAFLDERAGRAQSPAARMVFDSHRLSAYLAMGEPQKAVPMLEQAERDAPGDYNPPARLAVALQAMGRLGEARAATDRALARVSGPRRIRVLQTRASIEKDAGDVAAQRKWLQEALDLAKSLPEGQRSTKRIDALSDAIAKLPES